MSENYTLPNSKFGVTRTQYNITDIRGELPQRDVLDAANKLNHHRFTTLTAKQRLFVDSYLSYDMDATRAAINAGFVTTDPRYEEDYKKEARRVGNRLMKQPYILQAIELAIKYHREKHRIRVDDILNEYKNIAFAHVADFYAIDEHGVPQISLPPNGDPRLGAISEITVTPGKTELEGPTVKVKMHDKMKALGILLQVAQSADDGRISAEAAVNAKLLDVNNDSGNTTNNNYIQQIHLYSVPSGEFLPPPEAPVTPMKTIDGELVPTGVVRHGFTELDAQKLLVSLDAEVLENEPESLNAR
jgi:phage terminase small subunit